MQQPPGLADCEVSGKQEMTTAPYPEVSNELLSAYIDEAVSEDERRLIESAVAQDPDVAWRLESLRATVRLLHELPVVSLPRSFLLTPQQVSQAEGKSAVVAVLPQEAKRALSGLAPESPVEKKHTTDHGPHANAGGFWSDLWHGWMQLWQGGNPALRNAMAAGFAALLVLLLAPRFFAAPSLPAVSEMQTVVSQAPASAREVMRETETVEEPAAEEPAAEEPAALAAVQANAQDGARIISSTTTEAAAKTAGETDSAATISAAAGSAADVIVLSDAASAAAEAAPADASIAAQPTVLIAPAPAMAEGMTLAQSPAGASVLDEMQSQAGSSATEAASAAPAAPASVVESAPASAVPASEPDTVLAAAADATQSDPVSETAAFGIESSAAAVVASPLPLPPAAEAAAEEEAVAVALESEPQASNLEDATGLVVTPAGEVGALTAWLPLLLQTGLWLAALATLVFGLLWWRSRRAS